MRPASTAAALVCASALTLLACHASKGAEASQAEATPGGYASPAAQGADYERALERGAIDVWVSAPRYFQRRGLMEVWRGPRPRDVQSQARSQRPSFGSTQGLQHKLSRSKHHSTDLINLLWVRDDDEQLLFEPTPHAIVELALLAPTPSQTPPSSQDAPPAAKAPPLDPTPSAAAAATAAAAAADDPPAPEPAGPTLMTPPSHPSRVAARLPHWELPGLDQSVALACVALRRELPAEGDEEGPRWRYHGEIWLRGFDDMRTLTHGDEELEPISWQLQPDASPRLEVVMADAQGWPHQIDIIDLNTFQVRSLPTRRALGLGP